MKGTITIACDFGSDINKRPIANKWFVLTTNDYKTFLECLKTQSIRLIDCTAVRGYEPSEEDSEENSYRTRIFDQDGSTHTDVYCILRNYMGGFFHLIVTE